MKYFQTYRLYHYLFETFFDAISIKTTISSFNWRIFLVHESTSIHKPACHHHFQCEFWLWYRFCIQELSHLHRARKITMANYSKQTNLSWAVFKNDVCIYIVFKEVMKSHNISVHKVLVYQYLPCNLKLKEKLDLVLTQWYLCT